MDDYKYMGSDNDPRYKRLFEGYNDFAASEYLTYRIVDSLLDLPREGYTPPTDGAREDIMRLLYYDTTDPFSEAALTSAQKKSMIFDPRKPNDPPDAAKGYRIYLQRRATEAQTQMQTRLFVYTGSETADNDYLSTQAVMFDIVTGMNYEDIVDSHGVHKSRTLCIASRLKRAFNGVGMGGVGTISYNRRTFRECGMYTISDQYYNIGYRLTMCCQFGAS